MIDRVDAIQAYGSTKDRMFMPRRPRPKSTGMASKKSPRRITDAKAGMTIRAMSQKATFGLKNLSGLNVKLKSPPSPRM